MTKRLVRVYPGFERFWHWSQVLLIMVLLFTGFAISGTHSAIPFGPAVIIHSMAAGLLVVLWIFTVFWMITTGAWRQFVPRLDGMLNIARFYAWGVFHGEHHPYRKVLLRKHNPLQAATYFFLKWGVFSLIWLTGLMLLSFNLWAETTFHVRLFQWASGLHLWLAYVIVAFIIIHVYLLTVGHGFGTHIKPMITGYDTIDLTEEQLAYLAQNEPDRLKSSKN